MKRPTSPSPQIALALSGGGPLGAIYEIGALCALQESLNGIDFTRLQHYVGVSAGSFIAAGLANGMTPRELCALFIENRNDEPADLFDPSWLVSPAYGEFARRSLMLPGVMAATLWQLTAGKKSFLHAMELMGSSLPTGVFSNEKIDTELARLFSRYGRTNDFRQLKTQLTLVATNLDNGETAPFGRPGWEHVPISKAVQASSALPGLFPPVEIDEHYYVDGALKKTMHASVALDEGIDLLLCVNPLVPFDATAPKVADGVPSGLPPEKHPIPRIVDGGLPAVLSQTFRAMIHSRLVLGMTQYERTYPQTDIILIEPDQRDPELYLANTFSYAQSRYLAEHAYQQTRRLLRSRKAGLSAKLWRHGITLHHEALDDLARRLMPPIHYPTQVGQALSRLEMVLNNLSHIVRSEAHKESNTW
jgi:NTE family protein